MWGWNEVDSFSNETDSKGPCMPEIRWLSREAMMSDNIKAMHTRSLAFLTMLRMLSKCSQPCRKAEVAWLNMQ